MKDSKKIKQAISPKSLTRGALVAGLYITLTFATSLLGLSSGVLQLRVSEALCVLPAFMPEAVLGLYIGCILANLLTGCMIWDILFGSLATLIGALGAYLIGKLGKRFFPLIPIPTVLANALIIPLVLMLAYGVEAGYGFLVLSIGAGEILSAQVLGCILYGYLNKTRLIIHKN